MPTDADAVEAAAWFNGIGFSFGLDLLHKALDTVAMDELYDNVVAYLDGLPQWDGVERVCKVCIDGMGADDREWSRRMGELLIDSLVLRAYRPGSKVDTMPIFQQRNEGTFKSTFLAELVGGVEGRVFSDCVGDYSNLKQFVEQLGPNWLLEDGELTKLKTKEMEFVMKTLSSQVDEVRMAYGKRTIEKPRQCVIVGTTNQEEFLSSTNQNRRCPSLKVRRADVKWVKENRDQIFAEGVYRFKNGTAKPYIETEELKLQYQEAAQFVETEAWEDKVAAWLEGRNEFGESGEKDSVTTGEIAINVLGMAPATVGRGMQMRIAAVLRKLGWDRKTVWEEGRPVKKFFKVVRVSDEIF